MGGNLRFKYTSWEGGRQSLLCAFPVRTCDRRLLLSLELPHCTLLGSDRGGTQLRDMLYLVPGNCTELV